MADNVQHKIARNRPPRVQITYDVEIGDAIEKVEIPFVVGIMADLSGLGDGAQDTNLKDPSRSFVEIDRDNFGDVMAKIAPSLKISGALDENGNAVLDKDGNAVDSLTFKSLDDFNPNNLVKRIKGIKDLQDERSALRDILTKLDSNDALHDALVTKIQQHSLAALAQTAQTQLTALEAPATGTSDAGLGASTKTTAPAGKADPAPVADGTAGGQIAGGGASGGAGGKAK